MKENLDTFEIKNTNCGKLLEIKVDSGLNFSEHLDGIDVTLWINDHFELYQTKELVLYTISLCDKPW